MATRSTSKWQREKNPVRTCIEYKPATTGRKERLASWKNRIGNHTQSVKLVLLIHVTLHVEVAATITGPKQSVTLHVEVATTV